MRTWTSGCRVLDLQLGESKALFKEIIITDYTDLRLFGPELGTVIKKNSRIKCKILENIVVHVSTNKGMSRPESKLLMLFFQEGQGPTKKKFIRCFSFKY